MDDFALLQLAYEHGRAWIVELHIAPDVFSVVICVAVFAKMAASVVCTYVRSENAGALRSLRFSLRHVQPAAYCRFKCLLRHTAAAVHSVRCKLFSLRTRFYRDTVTAADLSKGLAYGDTLLHGPDLYAFFRAEPHLLGEDGVHPSQDGYEAMRKLWAETMFRALYR